MKWWLSICSLFFICYVTAINASLVIGIPYFKPPYVINQYEGFDVDLMHAICKRLNETCVFKQMVFNKLSTALNEGTIDLAMGAITISQKRQLYYVFTLPYKLSKSQFLVLKNSNLKSISDLKGKQVGAINSSDLQDFQTDNPLLEIQVALYEDPLPLISALSKHQLDAILMDSEEFNYWLQQTDIPLSKLEEPFSVGAGLGIMSLPKNTALIQSINQALIQLEKDGSYKSIYVDYFSD
ncbi:transporter substrate-binding domain-containing protein [Legionella quateirensis]|uniref:Arginine transport system periplasmic binding protein n=1 Tax=Legionella quateirensis TaxID=45072 RepID=A0A378KWR7_9GAMM|nr:transporter substrate-binding domain-containing protein [Legionella quateirensis]KTD42398.1 arginine transport system periplasmic binding protein [Legionella quateirensis]STY16260.1 arginine transport system substrate-binding protein [Legionella quateirensis]